MLHIMVRLQMRSYQRGRARRGGMRARKRHYDGERRHVDRERDLELEGIQRFAPSSVRSSSSAAIAVGGTIISRTPAMASSLRSALRTAPASIVIHPLATGASMTGMPSPRIRSVVHSCTL